MNCFYIIFNTIYIAFITICLICLNALSKFIMIFLGSENLHTNYSLIIKMELNLRYIFNII